MLAQFAVAQPTTTGKLKPVSAEGLYKIIVPPAVRSFSNADLSNFRIYDSKKNEVPYFVVQGNSQIVTQDFEQYPIVDKSSVPKKNTTYIVKVSAAKKLNQIALVINNSDMVKTYDLSGSNDKKQWFGISNKATLDQLSSALTTTVTKNISFPLSQYRYLKFVFNDSLTLPINVVRAENSWDEIRAGHLQKITPKSVKTEQLKEQKITIIHVEFDHPQIIDRIDFKVKAPRYYKRPVSIYTNAIRKVKRKNISYNDYICEFELSSVGKTSFDIPQTFEKQLEIEIGNKDNQPLDIAEIIFGQLPAYVVAELDANETYTFQTGDPKITTPQYDIAEVSHGNIHSLPETALTNIQHSQNLFAARSSGSFWQQPWFMWACIVLAAAAILFFTVSLVKDMK